MSERNEQQWRVIDTGIRRAAENFALNQAILGAHQAGNIPHTIRFLRFPPSVLVGFHQNIEQELKLEYCKEHNIDIQRRVTGGGAIFFDETQLGWELYLDKKVLGTADMTQISRRICEAAARGISSLGVDARFRPRNDIEVDGRKISGTGGAFDGDSIMFQGSLLIDFDVERMLRVLRIPAAKLTDKAIDSARDRVINLKTLLGEAPDFEKVKQAMSDAFAKEFGIEYQRDDVLTADEQARFAEALVEVDSDEWIYQHNRPQTEAPMQEAMTKTPGGLFRVSVLLDTQKQRLKQVWITGDFFVKPQRLVVDLEAALRDTPLADVEQNIRQFFAERDVNMLQLTEDDFIQVINAAIDTENS